MLIVEGQAKSVDTADKNGDTPLVYAAMKGFAEVRVPLFIMLGCRYGVRKKNYQNVALSLFWLLKIR